MADKPKANDGQDASATVTARVGSLRDFRPLQRNPNRHTQRGLKALESSIDSAGYVTPLTVAADGESLDGAARLEVAYDRLGEEAIVVEHDGRRPVVMVRTDIPNAETETARRIIYAANRVAELDLDWDEDVVEIDLEAGFSLDGLWEPEEQEALLFGDGRADYEFLENLGASPGVNETHGLGTDKSGGGPQGFPLAIVLQRDDLARWQAWKEDQGVRGDTDAFLALLEKIGG